jgi:hypothetical protein
MNDKIVNKEEIQRLYDEKFPIFEKLFYSEGILNERVVSVDKKWIGIKSDGLGKEVRFYNVSNGSRKGARKNSAYIDSIDTDKAIKIWEEHKHEKFCSLDKC